MRSYHKVLKECHDLIGFIKDSGCFVENRLWEAKEVVRVLIRKLLRRTWLEKPLG